MALREILLPWDAQPQEAVGPAIELGQDALLWSAVNPTLLLGAAAPAGSDASGSRSIGAPGIGRAWTRTANAGSLFGTFQHVSGLEITVAVVAAPVASSNRKVAFSQRTSASNAAQWYVGFNSDAGAGASSGSMSIIARNTAGTFPSSLAVGSQFDGGAHAWVCALGVGGGYVYRDGALQGTTGAAVSGTIWTSAQVTRIGNIGDYATDGLFVCDDPIYLVIVWPRVLPSEAARLLSSELAKNLGSAFHPQNIWVPVAAGGGGSHDATGAMSAQSATVSGSAAAVATYTSSGAPTAQAATVAGTANHVTTHASSGVLEAQAATVAGSADHSAAGAFSATGALTAQVATVAGSAAHLTLHTATGALVADSATAAGSAVHYTLHTAAGDLVADAASISGSALHEGDGAEVAKPFTGAGRPRRTRQRVVVEIDGEDFIAESSEEAQAILDQAKEAAEEKAKVAIERATKARNRPTRKVMADARKALELPAISAPDLGGYAEEISRQIEDIYQSAIQTIEVAALLRKRELEEEDDEDILMLL